MKCSRKMLFKVTCKRFDRFELLGICSNALEAKEVLNKHEVDLIFLDIQLPGMTGIEFFANTCKSAPGSTYNSLCRICIGKL